MLRKIISDSVLTGFTAILLVTNQPEVIVETEVYNQEVAIEDTEIPTRVLHSDNTVDEEQDEIRNEIMYGEIEELALLIQAEAGNQDELGKRYVADCVLNRVDDSVFPENIHDVIYQINPVQFSTTKDGSIEKAGYEVTEDCFTIALEEYENRTNTDIIYFRTDHYSECGKPAFKHGDHYFSTGR
ncbi:MAG: cell wall hydrolase [Bacilli bacterium]|nr:cell wall hydrolase [Bacilli bacterium]